MDNMTSFEAWRGCKSGVHFMHMFGCVVYARDTEPGLGSWSFVGDEAHAYRASTLRQVDITRDIIFHEKFIGTRALQKQW
jgi:hypothetical protein